MIRTAMLELGVIFFSYCWLPDVVYDLDIIPSLTSTISKLLSRKTSTGMRPVAIIACTIRNEKTEKHFLSQISRLHSVLLRNFYLLIDVFLFVVESGMSFIELAPAPQVFHCDRMYPVKLYEIHF